MNGKPGINKNRIDYRHYIVIFVVLLSCVLGAFVYQLSFLRLWESLKDFVTSLGFYFGTILSLEKLPVASVKNISIYPSPMVESFEVFIKTFKLFWETFVEKEVFQAYLKSFFTSFIILGSLSVIAFILLIIIFHIIKSIFLEPNQDHGKISKPLQLHYFFIKYIYNPVKFWVLTVVEFLKTNSYYYKIFLFIWFLNLNLVTIVIEAISFVFYFSVSFDFSSFLVQGFKLLNDIYISYLGLPWYLWIFILFLVFDIWRKKIGYGRLEHFEFRNRGLINSLSIVSLICGTMGKKKTTLITDMTLSQNIMFRDQSLQTLYKIELKYPDFPFIKLEFWLRALFESGTIYNLASCKKYINILQMQYFNFLKLDKQSFKKWIIRKKKKYPEKNFEIFFDYSLDLFNFSFDDALKETLIFDDLRTYAEAFFIYVGLTYVVSNYSIRLDDQIIDQGNFPLWNNDFFRRKAKDLKFISRHSKVLDFDVLRLGKTVVENNIYSGSFEFGVLAITEIGKERLNQLELQGVKKINAETNQKNDLMNYWLKTCRHSSTVDFNPYVKIFADEQRPESWGADARDLAMIVTIREAEKEEKITLPFFIWEDYFSELIINKFKDFYYNYRFLRGDNCLLLHVMKSFVNIVFRYRLKRFNTFGYRIVDLDVERGTQDGEVLNKNYFLMNKKIYSDRFSTDCFSEFFETRALRSEYGLRDYFEYRTTKASFEELQRQNSYFVISILNNLTKEEKYD